MGLRFDPMGGGQFKKLVEQLIEVEKEPVRKLEQRKQIVKAKLDLFRTFEQKFSDLQGKLSAVDNPRKLREFKVDLGDGEDLVDVSVDKNKATPGRYTLMIEEMAKRSSIISNGFETPTQADLGIGYVVVYTPDGGAWEIFIDDEESSLYAIAEQINRIPESPVSAAVVKDVSEPEAPWRLILNAKKDGYFNGVDFPEFYFLGGTTDFWIDDSKRSENALLEINDYPIEVESNDVIDFLPGVNLSLKQARPEFDFTMTITEDFEAVSGKVKELIGSINEILAFINEQNSIDDSTDTRTTFAGDTSLQGIEYRLRNLLHEGFPVGEYGGDNFRLVHLHELGVEFSKTGELSFNEDKFKTFMERDFEGVAESLAGEFGFVFQLGEVTKMYTRPLDGLLNVREKGIKQRIDQVDQNIEAKERMIEKRVNALVSQFSRLQGVLGNLQQQQQYVSAALGGQGGSIESLLGG